VLDQYCVSCHNQRLKTAELALDLIDVAFFHNGAHLDTVKGSAASGHPANGVIWLADQLHQMSGRLEAGHIVITGGTGVGKSYLACALGQSACRRTLRVTYRRVPRLLDELALARSEGSHARLLAKLAKFDVLVLDDWGLGGLKDSQRHDLLEVLEDRYGRVSTVVTSQLPIGKWHEWIADPTIADAIWDRVVNNAYKIDLKGPSGRRSETEPSNN